MNVKQLVFVLVFLFDNFDEMWRKLYIKHVQLIIDDNVMVIELELIILFVWEI